MATKTATSRPTAPARPPARHRVSAAAQRAFTELAELRPMFRSEAALARALGWQADTVSSWLKRTATRTRVDHRAQVHALHTLMTEAVRWTVEPTQAGDWVRDRQERLDDRTPATVLRVLGAEGLRSMLRHFARIAPRTSVGEPELPSADELGRALDRTLGQETGQLRERAARARAQEPAVDLSDLG